MNTINKFFFLFTLIAGFTIVGCVDNNFDEPQNVFTIDDSNVVSVRDIVLMIDPNDDVLLDDEALGGENKYIKATINADDASGNFYKVVSFQDGTAALSIMADRNELNAEFPEGSIVYVRLNGLTLALDANLPRLGYSYEDGRLQRIPDLLVNDFLISGGSTDVAITPIQVTIEEFQANPIPLFNALVEFQNVEFSLADVGSTYADPDNSEGPQSKNTTLVDCDDNEIIVRNSGYADFAGDIIPQGSGTLRGIASVFNDDLQLFIRDLNDVSFGDERCDGSGGQADNEITIQSIQDRFYDLGADKAEDGFITGVVISDRNSGQVNSQNVFIQNGEDGILIRFSSDHSFGLGDQLKVTVSSQEVSEYNGLLQINNVPLFNAEVTGNGALPTPIEITVDEILEDNNKYESTRVLIKGATLSGGSTFAGNVTVDDGTEMINIFTYNTSSYANEPVPSGTVDVIAIVSQYQDDAQLIINGTSDITGGTIDPGGNAAFKEEFNEGTYKEPLVITGWMNIATKGDRRWYFADYQDEKFAECEAYEDSNSETEAWLITPSMDTDENSSFSFDTQKAFWQHQGLSVWISPDFSDLADAQWTELDDATLANNSVEDYTWVSSGTIDLKAYLSGVVRVGFKYEGTSSSNTTKMRLDNVELR